MAQQDPFAGLVAAEGLDALTHVVSRAAAAVVAIDRSKLEWRTKADGSPVSTADEAANAIIQRGLLHLLPGVPVISEEECARPSASQTGFVLVDPLDGTREFRAGRDEFTVNVALVRDGRPVLGIIAAPALGLVWRGAAGQGAERLRLAAGAAPHESSERRAIHTRRRSAEGFVANVSRSHLDAETDAFLRQLPIVARTPCGSSLKFARIAEGSADLYVRLAQTCEWDVAAGHAILRAAGGIVTAPDGAELTYGRTSDFHVPGFIAWGDPCAAAAILAPRQAMQLPRF